MAVFIDYAKYYDLFYSNKDYAEEARTVDKLLNRYLTKDNEKTKIINLGCGTGKHDAELVKLGYTMHGIDLSSQMISIARERNADVSSEKLSFDTGDVRTYRSNEVFDAVISLFHVMSYQNTNNDILKAFESANSLLDKDGLFLFDAWYGPGVLTDLPTVRIKKVSDGKKQYIRHATPVMHAESNIVDVNYDVYIIDEESSQTVSFSEVHNMRYFFKPEIEYYLEQSGFELLDCLDCNTLEKTNYDSWTAYFIARKK